MLSSIENDDVTLKISMQKKLKSTRSSFFVGDPTPHFQPHFFSFLFVSPLACSSSVMTELCEDRLGGRIPRNHGRPTRAATCLHFRLQKEICCLPCVEYYDVLVTNPNKRRGMSNRKSCEQPWDKRYKTHIDAVKRKRFYEVSDFLGIEVAAKSPGASRPNFIEYIKEPPKRKKQKMAAPSA